MSHLPELPPLTVRSRIMDHLLARFRNSVAGQNGRYVTWSVVTDEPIVPLDAQTDAVLGIYAPREQKNSDVGHTRCTLHVTTEFHVRIAHGDRPFEVANTVLGEVQSVMLADIHCGGLTLNVVEAGNELDVDGPKDRVVSGIAFWEVLYRHRTGNPREQM